MSDFVRYAPVLLFELAIVAIAIYWIRYSKWKKGWLSAQIDARIDTMRAGERNRLPDVVRLFSPRNIYDLCRSSLFRLTASAHEYSRRGFVAQIRQWYFPSFSSFILIGLTIFASFALSHRTDLTLAFVKTKIFTLLDPLSEGRGITEIFAGLIAITVALIIFVAESIRESKSQDQKRVLLRIGMLWHWRSQSRYFHWAYCGAARHYSMHWSQSQSHCGQRWRLDA